MSIGLWLKPAGSHRGLTFEKIWTRRSVGPYCLVHEVAYREAEAGEEGGLIAGFPVVPRFVTPPNSSRRRKDNRAGYLKDQRCVISREGSVGIAVDGRDFVTRAHYYAIVCRQPKAKEIGLKNRIETFFWTALLLALWMVPFEIKAESTRQQAEKELTRPAPNAGLEACSLITRADVKNATGRDPFVDPESVGQGGWMCNVGTGELKVYSGPNSSETWESTLKTFKMDKEPRTPAPGFGEQAYFLYPKPAHKSQDNVAVLVAKSSKHTLVLSLDAPEGKPAESMRPALESLMKTILSRLP